MNTVKKSFLERALVRLKGGSEAQIQAYQTKTVRFYKEQIGLAEKAIEKAQERISEKQESIAEGAESPNLDLIKTTDLRDQYIKSQSIILNSLFNDVDNLEREILSQEIQITKYKKLISVFE